MRGERRRRDLISIKCWIIKREVLTKDSVEVCVADA